MSQRLNEIIQCKRVAITILIGASDVNGSFSEKNARMYIKQTHLPQKPSLTWFEEILHAVILKLQKMTNVRNALLSIPRIGEDNPSSYFNLS